MKKLYFIVAFLMFIFLGCEKKNNKIELLQNPESEYLSDKEVDTPIESKTKDTILENSLIDAIKSIHNSSVKDTLRYIVSLRLYINETGKIEKAKDVSTYYDRLEYGTDGLRNYTDRKKLNDEMLSKLSEWSFTPAKKNGVNVKSYVDLNNIYILALPDGKFQIDLPGFLSGIFSDNKFRITAEEMPFPVDGIKSIQEKIHYPEIAKRAGIEGKVYVLAFIDESGNVINARIIRGIGAGCDEAAIDAVKQTKFNPGREDGRAVKVKVTIPIVFKLQ